MPIQNTSDNAGKVIQDSNKILESLYQARITGRQPIQRLEGIHALLESSGIDTAKKYKLVAQGDSWFDYPGNDLINYLRDAHGHRIENIAVAGSTLNDIVYGPVPKNWLGIPQSDDVSRMEELLYLIEKTHEKNDPLQGVLLSGGGNDIAGPEFFSFLNNKDAHLDNPNEMVVAGVVTETCLNAYRDLIKAIFDRSDKLQINNLHIFIHGYDYPWPDGRGFTMFNLVGPWFDESFNKKNFPYNNHDDLLERRKIVHDFIEKFNDMLTNLASEHPHVHYVDLRGTLDDDITLWANELHPTTQGFSRLADELNLALHQAIK
jgi:lysophospholipase L1-like esterase